MEPLTSLILLLAPILSGPPPIPQPAQAPPTLPGDAIPTTTAPAPAQVEAPVTPAAIPLPTLTVRSRPTGALVYAGLSPLGETPLTVQLPEGEYPMAVYRPDSVPNRRPVRLEAEGKTWAPAIRKTWPPTEWGWPRGTPAWATDQGCRGQRRCGLGTARGFSPVLVDTTALARAVVEVARDRQTTVGRLEKTYVESWGTDHATVLQQSTRWRVRPARFERFEAEDGMVVWRVFGGKGGGQQGWPALGAGDALALEGDTDQMARAEIGALASALRWQIAARRGVKVKARQGTFIDGDRDRLLFEDAATLTFEGSMSGNGARLELNARLADLQAITQKHDVPVGTEYQTTDVIQLTLHAPVGRGQSKKVQIGVEAGVTRWIGAAEDMTPTEALKLLRKTLKAVGLSTLDRDLVGEVNGVPVVRVVLGPAVRPGASGPRAQGRR